MAGGAALGLRFVGSARSSAERAAAYDYCAAVAASHYENFPLGSLLLPRPMRRHIAAVYAFARIADDMADEGCVSTEERLARLAAWERDLDACLSGVAKHPVFVALGETIARFALPPEAFYRLLQAFRSDAAFQPFPSFAALREYCRCSADPVGHLILGLFGYRDAHRKHLADSVCTGLQLANFCQDVSVDAARGRVYLPLDELAAFGCSRDELAAGACNDRLRSLLAFQVQRARRLIADGERLSEDVDRKLAREVLLFCRVGIAILQQIEALDYDVFAGRPKLSRRAKLVLLLRVLGRDAVRVRAAAGGTI